MRIVTMISFGLAFLLVACSSDGPAIDIAAPADVVPTATSVIPSLVPDPSPTPVVVPTIVATEATPTPTATSGDDDADADSDADGSDADPTATATVVPTSTPRPIPTAVPTVAATAVPTPRPPRPTATPVWATPVPTTAWVNPDCYVAPGAADEPAWWCGGKLCWPASPHHGCPTTPAVAQNIEVGCTVSDRSIAVNDVITLRAFQDPANVPISYAFEHGDGTIDRTPESRAFYEAPGSYDVVLQWSLGLQFGRVFCGTVVVTGTAQPTPVSTTSPTVDIACSISDRDIVVNEVITLQASHSPGNVPVTYVFDHGDGTLDATPQSQALYLAPGFYDVKLQWAHSGTSGVISCGTVTVTPAINTANYLGRSAASAEALAISQGLTLRIVRVDAQDFPGTTDYRLDRINIEVDNGAVTKAYLG